MAEIVLTAVINKTIEVASNLIAQGSSRLNWLEEDMRWIERETRHIQSYLDQAESRKDERNGVLNLIKDIEELAHDIEDLLDTLLPWVASHKTKGHLSTATCIVCFGNDTAQNFSLEIEKIRRRVQDIDRVRTTYSIMDRGGNYVGQTWDPRRSFLYADKSEIVGLNHDSKKLKTQLLHSDLDNGVISIVGMPGIGKTTLGKEIYRRLQHQFDCSAQVYVSQEPSVGELLLDIAKQVGLENGESEGHIEANLCAYLREKRYIIFLDDIWYTRTWDAIKFGFPNSPKRGSRIIITSRNTGVGRYIGGENSLHLLQPLSQKNSWKLFSEMALSSGSKTIDPPGMEYVGRKIVEKCGGIPLAIVVTAGMLRERERTVAAWNGVLKSMGQDDRDDYSKVLAMSYKDLPSTLKPCFLYFGLFPEDHEIPAFQLINMWAAEKFITASGEREVEDVAEDCLNNLAARNLIQVASRRFDGRIRSCRMHDLLHDLCISVAKDSNFFHTIGNIHSNHINLTSRVRRFTYYRCSIDESDHFSGSHEMPKVRAILCFDTNQKLRKEHFTVTLKLGGLRFLRVLFVESYSFLSSLPDEIGNLSLLSYLRLRGYFHGNLPSSIRNLKNLMTLDLRECRGINLPTCIWTMTQLKFLLLSESATFAASSRKSQNQQVSLPSLRILDVVNCRYMEPLWLHKFTNLRKLGIRYPSKEISQVLSDARPILPKLENLRLTGSYLPTGKLNLSGYENLLKLHFGLVIEKLPDHDEFPPNLTKLTLRFTELEEDPFETLKKLPKLEILKLGYRSYAGREMVCSGADSFPQLRVLKLDGLYEVEKMLAEDEAMPKLETLFIRDSSILKTSNRLRSRCVRERFRVL